MGDGPPPALRSGESLIEYGKRYQEWVYAGSGGSQGPPMYTSHGQDLSFAQANANHQNNEANRDNRDLEDRRNQDQGSASNQSGWRDEDTSLGNHGDDKS